MFYVYVISAKILQINLLVGDCSVKQLSAGVTGSVSVNIGHENHKQQHYKSRD
jgi:hypothetical protein